MPRCEDELLTKNGKVITYITNLGWSKDGDRVFCATLLRGIENNELTLQERLEILDFMIDRLTKWRDEERKEQLIEELAELK